MCCAALHYCCCCLSPELIIDVNPTVYFLKLYIYNIRSNNNIFYTPLFIHTEELSLIRPY
jgi:hypothetical protein